MWVFTEPCAIGLALLVLFFVVGVMKTCGSFAEVKRPEHALKLFIRFALAKGAVTYGMEPMLALFHIAQGVISTIMQAAGFGTAQQTVLPAEIVTAVEDCGFLRASFVGGDAHRWAVHHGPQLHYDYDGLWPLFKLYLYTAIAPVPLSTFVGEPSQNVGKSFIKSYAAVCPGGRDHRTGLHHLLPVCRLAACGKSDASAVTMVWGHIGELVFNILVLVGAVKWPTAWCGK